MFSLSKESENSLKMELLALVANFLKSYEKPTPKFLGLMTQKQVLEELGVSYLTLQRWENLGLKRYTPPVEDTRTVFYKVDDILVFLGVR
ncbi:MerR family transcriptional regulator [Streptococcus equinus]|jgi:hypothetical protein|uniref:MerR family transcriptional regulator n=1 Tax=Streptococcus equinus TaxID=1335 RepID=UPI000882843E|nr:MerR family transcriptional regulator [Streptococcus equinus]SDJ00234.1 MerR HTH family regulatory protein [Streptococcus equinus]SEP95181.1 MerR HTH family regulatory protein [Streptococcus equinus]